MHASPSAAAAEILYHSDFSKAEVDQLPADLMVLGGEFTVKEVEGNRVLELPGAPLESFGLLFGPTEAGDLAVSARIWGTSKGRRSPTFAVGLAGVTGYHLRVAPSSNSLELVRDDQVVTRVDFTWKTGAWTHLRLELARLPDGQCRARGKAWSEGQAEPAAWAIQHTDQAPPPAGRASIWGAPYAGTEIRFDDLLLTRIRQQR